MDIADVERWATVGAAPVLEQLVLDPDSLTLNEIGSAMRAAYARGYVDALEAAEPPIIHDAMTRLAALEARLPLP